MLQCNLNGFKAHLPQAHGSFKAVLLVSLLVAVSPSRSTGLQLGTDAGMSSVLLTMFRFPQDLFGFGVSNRCPLLRAVERVCCMAFSVRRNGCLVICKDITKTTLLAKDSSQPGCHTWFLLLLTCLPLYLSHPPTHTVTEARKLHLEKSVLLTRFNVGCLVRSLFNTVY